jgi:hypothetical protein
VQNRENAWAAWADAVGIGEGEEWKVEDEVDRSLLFPLPGETWDYYNVLMLFSYVISKSSTPEWESKLMGWLDAVFRDCGRQAP